MKSIKWRIKSLLPRKTPLAWSQLSHQKIRLLVAIIGVAFSNILIFSQLGLRALLFDGVTLVPKNLNGDLFILSKYARNIRRSSGSTVIPVVSTRYGPAYLTQKAIAINRSLTKSRFDPGVCSSRQRTVCCLSSS